MAAADGRPAGVRSWILGLSGQVRGPQRVAPPVGGLEQGQLGAGVRALGAGEDPHRLRPGLQLVAAGALAKQPGQLDDVRFFYPAGRVRATRALAGVIGAALADLPLPSIAASQAP
jgi:hypothetical protein